MILSKEPLALGSGPHEIVLSRLARAPSFVC